MNPKNQMANAILAAARRGRRPAGAPLVNNAADIPAAMLTQIRAQAAEEMRKPYRGAYLLKRAFAVRR